MRPIDRITARRQLDKRLNTLRNLDTFMRPSVGWIKAIRKALGMTTAQLAKIIGVSQPRAFAIEKAEKDRSITLESLERAAHALDCELVYTLVPRIPLNKLVEERAQIVASKRLKQIQHSMALEAQSVNDSDNKEQFKSLVRQLVEKAGSELWHEEE